jgi:hypothetical protein
LTWIPERNSVQVTGFEQGDRALTSVSYDARDLAAIDRRPAALVKMIQSNIAPTRWAAVGGPGTIAAGAGGAVLEVRQTFRVHQQVEQLLAGLRAVCRP